MRAPFLVFPLLILALPAAAIEMRMTFVNQTADGLDWGASYPNAVTQPPSGEPLASGATGSFAAYTTRLSINIVRGRTSVCTGSIAAQTVGDCRFEIYPGTGSTTYTCAGEAAFAGAACTGTLRITPN